MTTWTVQINGALVGAYPSYMAALAATQWTHGVERARRSGQVVTTTVDRCAQRVIVRVRPDVD